MGYYLRFVPRANAYELYIYVNDELHWMDPVLGWRLSQYTKPTKKLGFEFICNEMMEIGEIQ